MTKYVASNVHEATGVNVAVLFKDATSLEIDLDTCSSYELADRIDELFRNGNNVPYPSKSDYTVYNVYHNGKVLVNEGTSDARDEAMKAHPKSLVEKIINEDLYKHAKDAYQYHQSLLRQTFIWGLFYLEDVMDNPKAQMAFNLAWEHGHSSGYIEVQSYFDEFVELIK